MKRRTTTQRGLGHAHRQHVRGLFSRLADGTPCWWCARPMYRTAERNWDKATLEGDHSQPRSQGGRVADRLLHSTCNRQRSDGRNDHLRPALTGAPFVTKTSTDRSDLGVLAMAWPRQTPTP